MLSEPNASLSALLTNLIDYAGRFAPVSLPLDEAFNRYVRYRCCEDRWLLGRFLVPATELEALSEIAEPRFEETIRHYEFSVIGRNGKTEELFLEGLEQDRALIDRFAEKYGEHARVDVFEVRLPPVPELDNRLHDLIGAVASHYEDLRTFVEIPDCTQLPNWEEMIRLTVEALADFNESISYRNGLKIRCGGETRQEYPTAEQVAYALITCRDHRVPFKATYGLHRPIRQFNPEIGVKEHGFINIFTAGVLSSIHNLSWVDTQRIIQEEDPHAFRIDSRALCWRDLSATIEQIDHARAEFLSSFGSASFDIPRQEMVSLGWA